MKKLLLILILFCSAASFAQPADDTTKYSFATYLYGQKFNKAIFKDILNIPYQDTGTWRPQTPGAILIRPADDLLYIWNGVAWSVVSGGGGGGGTWGSITGTLSAQTDLQAALDALQDDIDNKTILIGSRGTGQQIWFTNVDSLVFKEPANTYGLNWTTDPLDSSLLATIDPAIWQGKITVTTIGSSGAAILIGNVLNIPQYSGGGGGSGAWGAITGTITDQTDLVTLVNGKVADAINDGTTAIAPSQNAVFDALALKQGNITLTTTGSSGAATLIGSTLNIPQYSGGGGGISGSQVPDFTRHSTYKMEAAMGSTVKYTALNRTRADIAGAFTLLDGQARYVAVEITEAQTITGVSWFQITAGNITDDNNNKVALFSFDGTDLTLVASSTNDGTLWEGASNTMHSKAFSTPYSASPGLYYIGLLMNQSAGATPPTIGRYPLVSVGQINQSGFANGAALSMVKTTTNDFPATIAASSMAFDTAIPYAEIY